MQHRATYKVYYEDTDCLGMVYYANYLKFLERGRTDAVDSGVQPIRVWNDAGYYFVVYGLNMRFRKSARLGDLLEVLSTFALKSAFRGVFQQRILRGPDLIVEAEVEVVCVDAQQRLREFPEVFPAD